jgi:hypothetical protein
VFKGEMKGLKDDETRNAAQGDSAQRAPQSGARPAAPAEPAALPPADAQVNQPVNGAGTTAPQPVQPVRPDTDR